MTDHYPGQTYQYRHKEHKVEYLVVLLSSDKIPGWKTSEEIWRCAQFMIGNDKAILHGAQIVLHTASELSAMSYVNTLYPVVNAEYSE